MGIQRDLNNPQYRQNAVLVSGKICSTWVVPFVKKKNNLRYRSRVRASRAPQRREVGPQKKKKDCGVSNACEDEYLEPRKLIELTN